MVGRGPQPLEAVALEEIDAEDVVEIVVVVEVGS